MKRRVAYATVAAILAVLVGGLANGWWSGGHETIAEAAAARLPDDVPAFFRRGGKELAHFAVDPDRWKNREMGFLRRAEEGNHFLDTEDLDGKPLPATHRFDAMKMIYGDLKKEPNKVGLLPYAIMENYEKLIVAFYDYRKSPDEPCDPDEVPGLWRDARPLHRRRRHAAPHHPRLRRPHPARWHSQAEGHSREGGRLPGEEQDHAGRGLPRAGGEEDRRRVGARAKVHRRVAHAHPKCYELDAAGASIARTRRAARSSSRVSAPAANSRSTSGTTPGCGARNCPCIGEAPSCCHGLAFNHPRPEAAQPLARESPSPPSHIRHATWRIPRA